MRDYDGLKWIRIDEIEDNFVISSDRLNEILQSGEVREMVDIKGDFEEKWACVIDLKKFCSQKRPSRQRSKNFKDNVAANILGAGAFTALGSAFTLVAKELLEVKDLVEKNLAIASTGGSRPTTNATPEENGDDEEYLEQFGHVKKYNSRTGKGVVETIGRKQLVVFDIGDVDTSGYNFPIALRMLMSFEITTEDGMKVAKRVKTQPPELIEYILDED